MHHSSSLYKAARQQIFSEADLAAQRAQEPLPIAFSLVTPLYNTPEPYLRAMLDSVLAQTHPLWELCLADGSDAGHPEVERVCREYAARDPRIRYRRLGRNLGISGNSNAALELATGDYVGLLDHDDVLHPAALHEVARAIRQTGAEFVYTDEAHFTRAPADAYNPNFKPAFAPDTLRANNYLCHFSAFSRELLEAAGPFDPSCDGAQDHDLFLRLTERAGRVAHVPEVLYYWRAHAGSTALDASEKGYAPSAGMRAVQKQLERLGLAGDVEPVRPGLTIYRTRYAIAGAPLVSILIPNREHLCDLRACLDSIFSLTTWPNYEVVIVENDSFSPELFAYYEQIQQERTNVRVVRFPHTKGFNYSSLNNFGAEYCNGEYLLLLNNDTQVITRDWIQEMLMFAQRKDVGVVGPKLLFPDGHIQQAGVGIGLGGVAAHFCAGAEPSNLGYMGRLIYAQDLSAVTGACLLMRRAVWDELGGLDEQFAVNFNDIDLCLCARKAGYLVVWTPFAELYHFESASRGLEDTPEKQRRFAHEIALFQERWHDELEAGDPYYSPNLSLNRNDFCPKPVLTKHDAR